LENDTMTTLRESDLTQFCGSAEFYQHWTKRLVYTEGVQYMAERGGAYWLIDAVASYQPDKRIASRPDLVDFQLWELVVAQDKSATLMMRGDSDQPAVITQEIPFTDFPLERIKLYVSGGTLMLPSEY
jgi:hypothetical protein